jgi:tRNA U34 2-thiouridine synthase MnmA/TrmU
MKPGPFVCVDGNIHLGTHAGIAAYTHGERAGISGVPKPFYVVGKDVKNNIVFVAPGADHPALFCTSVVAGIVSNSSDWQLDIFKIADGCHPNLLPFLNLKFL